jgi:hypothetical protein
VEFLFGAGGGSFGFEKVVVDALGGFCALGIFAIPLKVGYVVFKV